MPSTKTDYVIDTLGCRIINGQYLPGTPLPSELKLGEEFRLSRNVIREALRSLVCKKLIENTPYRGAYVSPRSCWNYLDPDVLRWELTCKTNPQLLEALDEIRYIFDPIIARWAAGKATSRNLAEIEQAFDLMEANKNDIMEFNNASIAFHRSILMATRNVLLQQFDTALSMLLYSSLTHERAPGDADVSAKLQAYHALLEAIRCRKHEDAENAALTILSHIKKNSDIRDRAAMLSTL